MMSRSSWFLLLFGVAASMGADSRTCEAMPDRAESPPIDVAETDELRITITQATKTVVIDEAGEGFEARLGGNGELRYHVENITDDELANEERAFDPPRPFLRLYRTVKQFGPNGTPYAHTYSTNTDLQGPLAPGESSGTMPASFTVLPTNAALDGGPGLWTIALCVGTNRDDYSTMLGEDCGAKATTMAVVDTGSAPLFKLGELTLPEEVDLSRNARTSATCRVDSIGTGSSSSVDYALTVFAPSGELCNEQSGSVDGLIESGDSIVQSLDLDFSCGAGTYTVQACTGMGDSVDPNHGCKSTEVSVQEGTTVAPAELAVSIVDIQKTVVVDETATPPTLGQGSGYLVFSVQNTSGDVLANEEHATVPPQPYLKLKYAIRQTGPNGRQLSYGYSTSTQLQGPLAPGETYSQPAPFYLRPTGTAAGSGGPGLWRIDICAATTSLGIAIFTDDCMATAFSMAVVDTGSEPLFKLGELALPEELDLSRNARTSATLRVDSIGTGSSDSVDYSLTVFAPSGAICNEQAGTIRDGSPIESGDSLTQSLDVAFGCGAGTYTVQACAEVGGSIDPDYGCKSSQVSVRD